MLADDARFLHLDEWLVAEGQQHEDSSIVALIKLRRVMVSVLW